jgi:uncharacterized membrane protein YphA (DoxX/SURF4 family)
MSSRFIVAPCLTGVVVLLMGLWSARKDLAAASGVKWLIVIGPACFAAPLALFGAEHIVSSQAIMQAVPPWMPGRLFWTYFVGFALIAAALSIVLSKFVRLSSTLLSVMFFLFVALVHTPRVLAHATDRFAWTVEVRDTSFAAGAWALAAASSRTAGWRALAWIPRLLIAVALVDFGVQHILHPEFEPGVPLAIMTPAWVPLAKVWGYLVGAVLLAAGASLLAGWKTTIWVACVGGVIVALTLFINLPSFVTATKEFTLGMNVVADTLLFGGAVLLLGQNVEQGGRT